MLAIFPNWETAQVGGDFGSESWCLRMRGPDSGKDGFATSSKAASRQV